VADVPPRAALEAASRIAVDALLDETPELLALAQLLRSAGHEVALVGGSVRDAIRGVPGTDLDVTTSAPPEIVLGLVHEWADAVWDIGISFGTVGVQRGGERFEITTYRSDSYDRTSRRPKVTYGDSLIEDLRRRDFTINALAVTLPEEIWSTRSTESPTWPEGSCVRRRGRRIRSLMIRSG
jgi:poly(A) polymerase